MRMAPTGGGGGQKFNEINTDALPIQGAVTQLYLATSPEIESKDIRGQQLGNNLSPMPKAW